MKKVNNLFNAGYGWGRTYPQKTRQIQQNNLFVDLGLPSGLLWASCNLGAKKPEEFGLYYAWGETTGYNYGEDKQFSLDDYKFYKNGYYTKYLRSDANNVLELVDDAAYQADNSTRMPTFEEANELIENTTQEITELNGVQGMLFTSKINNNSIFIPSSGYVSNNTLTLDCGSVWLSNFIQMFPDSASRIFFNENGLDTYNQVRYMGCTIRPVRSV